MFTGWNWKKRLLGACVASAAALSAMCSPSNAQVVPGTGTLYNTDDFEDENWSYVFNFPKSSKEEDEQIRYPLGGSTNGLWVESPKRGAPDQAERIATPPGGIEGSNGALLIRSRDTGIPGRPMGKQCQDDFILKAKPLSIGYQPSFVVRVYLPEWDQWEQRNGVSFGIRAGMQGPQEKLEPTRGFKRLFGSSMETVTTTEPYYPGFFIQFNPATSTNPDPHAILIIRANESGQDMSSRKITQPGWWTFGMSITSDGRCHYYARAGVDDLTAGDYLASMLPYGIRGNYFNTIFFNVCSADNGQSWSTPWVIDDPKVYYGGQSSQYVQQPNQQYRR